MNYLGYELLETDEEAKYLLVHVIDDYNSVYINDVYLNGFETWLDREEDGKGYIQKYLNQI